MDYLQSRYYSPKWGRFINADGVAGNIGDLLSHNLFLYCSNNPKMYSDPSGFIRERDNVGLAFGGTLTAAEATQGLTELFKGICYAVAGIIGAAGNAIFSSNTTKSISNSKTTTATITNTKKPTIEYHVASRRKGGGINILNPITMIDAQLRILSGKDVYAVSQLYAENLAVSLGGYEPGTPERHAWSPLNKYHYHLTGRVGGHIFFN